MQLHRYLKKTIEYRIPLHMAFADYEKALNIILFAESEEKLKNLLEDLNKEGKRDGMKMNKKKTKIMGNETASKQQRRGLAIDGEDLEER